MKSLVINLLLFLTVVSNAQIMPLHAFSQYALTSLQPTYAPYNHLDKLDMLERNLNTDRIKSKKLYFNLSNRGSKGCFLETNTATFDYILNPEFRTTRSKLGAFKFGMGVLHNGLDDLNMNNYFAHISYIYKLKNISGTSADNWGFGAGFLARIVTQTYEIEKAIYKDPDDPKIRIVEAAAQKPFTGYGLSLNVVNVKHGYLGFGYQWIGTNEHYSTLTAAGLEAFKEWNFIGQWAWGGRARNVPNAPRVTVRGPLSHHNILFVARTQSLNFKNQTAFYQMNYRVSLADYLWLGAGVNSANRGQLQLGVVRIPKTYETSFVEQHYSLSFDWKPKILTQQVEPQFIAIELNVGFFL
jgi:hypothetical protein